jgi:hypothetical protein
MKLAPWGLLALALLQMSADVLGLVPLRALAAATGASPAPRVFSAVRGLETFSTRFTVEWVDRAGTRRELLLTSAVNARLRGPYNRRNVYGAVLAYGPVLSSDPATLPLFESVARYALCDPGTLLAELGIDRAEVAGSVRIRLEPRPGSDVGALPLVLDAPCS